MQAWLWIVVTLGAVAALLLTLTRSVTDPEVPPKRRVSPFGMPLRIARVLPLVLMAVVVLSRTELPTGSRLAIVGGVVLVAGSALLITYLPAGPNRARLQRIAWLADLVLVVSIVAVAIRAWSTG